MKPFSLPMMRALLADIIPAHAVVSVGSAGGDVDTAGLSIGLPGSDDKIFLSAFRTDHQYYQENRGEETPVEAEMIELRDSCSDSRGGIQTRNEELAIIAARIKVRLLQNGWQIADTLKDYF